ncbi:MAG: protein-L-isoaspartate(D-aspartate) O-methyltransferase [Candidatus Aenigmarchaeota archaeon]|nr:protein-L-isoaspartate(D-aspartate) O-methyltransferase [Candidatus Aenigmarchaeota archaeon]
MAIDSNADLIAGLVAAGYLKSEPVIRAFHNTDRKLFVPQEYADNAYLDEPLPIGQGQTISAPHMVAIMTELLQISKADKVLEIGSGSGYQAAILARLAKKVYSIEADPALARQAEQNLAAAGSKNVKVMTGDGRFGHKPAAPYARIVATCGLPDFFPELARQLKAKGIFLAPIETGYGYQDLVLARKKGKDLEKEKHGACAFVPYRSLENAARL